MDEVIVIKNEFGRDLGIFEKKEQLLVSSRVVAEVFGKEHGHVLRDIRNLECSEEFNRSNFGFVKYIDEKGELRPEVLMTRDGFVFLAMGFTGKRAAAFKEAYIRRFNEMEHELHERIKERELGKEMRYTLTDYIRDSGLNERMHGWAYKNFTDLVYAIALRCTAKQYREKHGLDKGANIRDYLSADELCRVKIVEKTIAPMIQIGKDYQQIKGILPMIFGGWMLEDKSESHLKLVE